MANTHTLPNMAGETQAMFGDLLAPVILASTLTTPGSGMTLPAFSTYGYVRNGSPTRLVYVNQPAAPVTIAGGPGAYWLALMHDTHSAVAGWTRVSASHYCWQAAATQPADPAGGLVMAGVTVTGANITAVDITVNWPWQKVAFGGAGGQLAFDKNLTWNGVRLHIAGEAEAKGHLTYDVAGDNVVAFYSTLNAAGGSNRWAFNGQGTAPSYLGGSLQVNGTLQINSVGIGVGGPSVAGYALITHTGQISLTPNVSVGLGTVPATATLDVNGSVRARTGFSADNGATVTGTMTATQLWATAYLGAGGGPDNRFSLRSYGANYFDGVGQFIGLLTASGGIAATTGTFYGHVQGQSTATFALQLHAQGPLIVDGALTAYGHTHLNASFYFAGSGTVAGTLTVGAKTTMYTAQASYLSVGVEPNYEGFPFHILGEAKFRNSIRVDGTGYKPGGGSWGDSSSALLKRNIAPIDGALTLLLGQHGRVYEWDEPQHAAVLPGPRYGLIAEEVTIPQWKTDMDDGSVAVTIQGFEALTIEALRTIVERLETLESGGHPR